MNQTVGGWGGKGRVGLGREDRGGAGGTLGSPPSNDLSTRPKIGSETVSDRNIEICLTNWMQKAGVKEVKKKSRLNIIYGLVYEYKVVTVLLQSDLPTNSGKIQTLRY